MLNEHTAFEPIIGKTCDQSLGFYIRACAGLAGNALWQRLMQRLEKMGALSYLMVNQEDHHDAHAFHVSANDKLKSLTPDYDTTQLASNLRLNSQHSDKDLELEIVLAMARSPFEFNFPDMEEFEAAIRMRLDVVRIAARAQISFGTGLGEVRPDDYFHFHPDTSFTLIPGVELIDALSQAINPPNADRAYSFSCYRASEYVMALALAREFSRSNPALLQQMQNRWMRQPIMSKEFHEILLFEYGSLEDPVPMKFYVPGARVWFKNPDDYSSDVIGFEGSWVCYLGSGLFNNFWKSNEPFTLQSKCLEIYHWRHGAFMDSAGVLQMDETIVEQHVNQSLAIPGEVCRILEKMLRYRDPSGVYGQGGCIDASREHLRWVCPNTTNINIPQTKINLTI